jgi:hypothetical protein
MTTTRQTITTVHVMDVYAPFEQDRVYLNIPPRSSAGAFEQTANKSTLRGMSESQPIVEFNIPKIRTTNFTVRSKLSG